MRVEPSSGGAAAAEFRCAGLNILFHEDAPVVRHVPGKRRLADGALAAVLRGLASARELVEEVLHLDPKGRPYDKVEIALGAGALVQGEATSVGAGAIRLFAGEEAPPEEIGSVARHEAIHLLLASALPAGELWNDPELAFADWIVRGVECGLDPAVPRFHATRPQILDRLPTSRGEVQRRIAELSAAPEASRRYFGEPLHAELSRLSGDGEAAAQRQLWVVEAALGAHAVEAAGRALPEDGEALRATVLDDWLLEYERYARSLGNAPQAAANLWRVTESGYSRDPLVRLSVAAQALQRDDQCFFAGDRFAGADEPVVWKSRGRIRLPLVPRRARTRPAPVHGLRAVLRGVDAPRAAEAISLVEQAARAGADRFEARALWPRILARLVAAGFPPPDVDPDPAALPVVQIVESADGAAVERTFRRWSEAADALRAIAPELSPWMPAVLAPVHLEALHESPRRRAAMLLVHAGPLSAASLVASRAIAAKRPVRAALFDDLGGGSAYERVADLDEPLDPRYREQVWTEGPLPADAADLVRAADAGTADGIVTTPVCHLLSATAIGLEECEYHLARGPRAARG